MFNSIDVKFDGGVVVAFQRIGMTEVYELEKLFSSNTSNEKQSGLVEKLEPFKKMKGKKMSDEQKAIFAKLTRELNDANVQSDIQFRAVMMRKAVSIKKGKSESGKEDAALFVDTLHTLKLVEVFEQIKPDIEKNSPSQ